eukprot:SAG31_NODE_3856_length_3815_cov_3.607374_4_plen_170_part_00
MGQREGGEHEASRRFKTEMLIQMDGLAKRREGSNVFVLAASNLPWELDQALLRRLEKRIVVPLPCAVARQAILELHLRERAEPDLDFSAFTAQTEGYSGSDLVLVCKEAAMRPLRRLMSSIEDDDVRTFLVLTLLHNVGWRFQLRAYGCGRATAALLLGQRQHARSPVG